MRTNTESAGDVLDMQGRVAIVTGAGRGVGRKIALLLGRHNASVVVNDYYPERADQVASEIVELGGSAVSAAADVSDFDAVHALAEKARSHFGVTGILVNNAGNAGPSMELGDWRPFWETDPDEWQNWLGVNLYGVMNTAHAVLPQMKAAEFGRIVTIVSDAGRVGDPRFAAYSAAKAGAAGFIRSIARSVGRYGITANCLALGGIDTPGAESILSDEKTVERMLSQYVIRRVGLPEDIGYFVLYLSSDAAGWITGQTYPVNGGFSFAL